MMTGAALLILAEVLLLVLLGAGRMRRERLWDQERYLLEAEVERAEDRAFRAEARATAAEDALRLHGGPFR